MTDKTCFVHVGTVKTGSSALQYALAHSREYLKTHGYIYPDRPKRTERTLRGEPVGGNALEVLLAFRAGDIKSAIDLATRLEEDGHHLILSNEALFRLPAPQLKELHSALVKKGYRVRCLVTFRPQTELILSAYLQLIKSNAASAAEGLERYVAGQDFVNRRNWWVHARKLEDVFGLEHLAVRWLPDVIRTGGVIKAGFDWLGLPAPALEPPIINPTPGREAMAVLQLLNESILGGRKFSDEFLMRAAHRSLLGNKMTLDAESARHIFEATRDSNAQLLQRYCHGLSPSDELKPPVPGAELPHDPHTVQELADLAQTLLIEHGVETARARQAFQSLRDSARS
jgi:hypothetical protein